MTPIENLQALRGLAAAMVVLHHVRDLVHEAFPGVEGLHVGAAGVDIFFVLSGVVIATSLRAREQRVMPRQAIRPTAFLLRRVLRVVPMYWLALGLVATMLAAGLAPLGVAAADADLDAVLKSLFFVPFERAHGAVMPLLGVGWTLNYEMFFYVIFAASLLARPALRLPAVLAIIGTLVAAGLLLAPQGVVGRFYTNPILLEFAAGVLLAHLWLERPARRGDTALGAGLVALGVVWLVAVARHDGFAQLMPERVLVFGLPALAIVAGALVLDGAGLRFGGRVWALLGAASYATYLFHSFVLQAIGKAAHVAGLPPASPVMALALVLVAVLASHLAGILIHLRVERPVSRALAAGVARSRWRAPSTPDRLEAASHGADDEVFATGKI